MEETPRLTVERPRLIRVLDEGPRRLVSLVAPPGSGKTTLIRQWLTGRQFVWHSVRPADRSLSTLARSLIDELRAQTPDLSAELLLALEGARGPDTGGAEAADRADALAAAVCQDLASVLRRPLFLVLDDAHHISPESASAPFVAALVRHAPERLGVLIASREPPPFPTARLRLQREAAEIGPDVLAFTEEEVTALMEGRSGDPATAAQTVFAETGGWPVAVVFAARAMERGSDLRPDAAREATALFEYLAEEVVATEPAAVVETLRIASELPWVTPDLVDHVLPGGGDHVLDPEWRNVYVTPVTTHPHAVAVTPLVRSFLRDRHGWGPKDRAGILRRAAEWYEQEAALTEALECLMDAEDWAALAELLSRRGPTMLAAGLARPLVEAIERLPASEEATLLLLEAEARQVVGDWEGSTRCYEVLAPSTGPIPAGVAWRLGLLHHMRGDSESALAVYRRGAVEEGEIADQAALLGWMASAHWLRGERDEAKSLADRALDLAWAAGDSRSLATAHTVLAMVAALDGDRASNDTHYVRALEHAERSRDVVQTIRIRSNRGSHFLEEGDYDRALTELEIALRLANLSGFELWRAMTLSNQAQVRFARGELDEAVADLEEARAIFLRLGSNLESYPLAHLGDVYAARGDTALARAAYEQAVSLAEGPSDLQALVPALSGLARVVVDDDPDRALEMTERATAVESVLGHVKALLAHGWVALARGDDELAASTVARVKEVATARRDLPGLAEAHEIEAALADDPARAGAALEQAQRLWAEVGGQVGEARVSAALAEKEGGPEGVFKAEAAADRLEALGAKLPAMRARRLARSLGSTEARSVTVKTLGGFAVTRDGVEVAASEWQSKVAREVLWMLVANRGRPLHREVLISRLWPDDDSAKAANRLSVALTTIRNVLSPGRGDGDAELLAADRDGVAVVLAELSVDLESFLNQAGLGLGLLRQGDTDAGLAALRAADATYVGEFLEEAPYAEWAVATREEARSVYLTVAGTLAEAETAAGNYHSAARRYLRMLERDAYNEPAHLGLVAAMSAAGRHGTARRLYGLYASRMAELGVEPSSFPEFG